MESRAPNNGRVALVTGGSRGIGLGIAAWLIVEGWQVVIADVDRRRGAIVAQELGDNAWFVALDVSSEPHVALAVAEVLGQFGRLDALINNAGIADPINGPLEELTLAHWNRVLAVNLTGAMLLAKHCAAYLRSHHGSIINVSSSRAHQSEPHTEAYSATKGGLLALTHAMAVSLGPEIRVNAVSPGWIDSRDPSARRDEPLGETDHAQHPAGRVGEVEDIASAVAWLLSPDSEFVTGQEFVIDGGMTRKMIYAE
ncbi:SDR family oxidoreductase [Pseudomonas matsuisoli]|jgi:NAD(P)-dependent dehydrogenase (short-subunit alcohol dehydrogenase family)|uniref:Oxidoreductase n=1 Tax=Pseudomonas matsuisoli TaxID=1515666 RepID=A0A917UR35_9PSED|nr:SDR family oxidoreductase [Pseudomonas matsuisoli]GGJ78414.1 oxidoreductase [Pseudomonas matsuisoli]